MFYNLFLIQTCNVALYYVPERNFKNKQKLFQKFTERVISEPLITKELNDNKVSAVFK